MILDCVGNYLIMTNPRINLDTRQYRKLSDHDQPKNKIDARLGRKLSDPGTIQEYSMILDCDCVGNYLIMTNQRIQLGLHCVGNYLVVTNPRINLDTRLCRTLSGHNQFKNKR